VAAYFDVITRKPEEPASLDTAIAPPKVTIRQKVKHVADQLRQFGRSSFRKIIGRRSTREEIGVTFLALLELIKLHFVEVSQEGLFADIEIQASEKWEGTEDIELEFGE
jgi:segregation and condensation protein A